MAEEGFQRKLTATLNTDIVGYCRFMDDSEEATIKTLNIYRNSMTMLIDQHRGGVAATPKYLATPNQPTPCNTGPISERGKHDIF